MKQTVTVYDFCDFMKADPFSNYSHDALLVIFDHIEQIEELGGEEMELNSPEIRGRYSEYKTKNEALKDIGLEETELEEDSFLNIPGGGVVLINK